MFYDSEKTCKKWSSQSHTLGIETYAGLVRREYLDDCGGVTQQKAAILHHDSGFANMLNYVDDWTSLSDFRNWGQRFCDWFNETQIRYVVLESEGF